MGGRGGRCLGEREREREELKKLRIIEEFGSREELRNKSTKEIQR